MDNRMPMSNSMLRMQQVDRDPENDKQMEMLRWLLQNHPNQRQSILEWFMKKQRYDLDKGLNDQRFGNEVRNQQQNLNGLQSMQPNQETPWNRFSGPYGKGM